MNISLSPNWLESSLSTDLQGSKPSHLSPPSSVWSIPRQTLGGPLVRFLVFSVFCRFTFSAFVRLPFSPSPPLPSPSPSIIGMADDRSGSTSSAGTTRVIIQSGDAHMTSSIATEEPPDIKPRISPEQLMAIPQITVRYPMT